jgi:hypothetical protein
MVVQFEQIRCELYAAHYFETPLLTAEANLQLARVSDTALRQPEDLMIHATEYTQSIDPSRLQRFGAR